jgi:hypothetical protein
MAICKCCKREKELRMGYCIDCVDSESVIVKGVTIWDNKVEKKEGLSEGMSKLQHILSHYIVIKDKSNGKYKRS